MYVDSPQAKTDLEMGVFWCLQIYRQDVAELLLGGGTSENEAIH